MILNYNIFGVGGTVTSNKNLVKEIFKSSKDNEIIILNKVAFNKNTAKRYISNNNLLDDNISFDLLSNLKEYCREADVFLITRESYFPMAHVIRKYNTKAFIVAEVHGPLELILEDINKVKNVINVFRVGSEFIKKQFIENYNASNVVAFPISVDHLEWEKTARKGKTKNIKVFSRFDDEVKDISYAIKLMKYVFEKYQLTDVHLHINGAGPDINLYRQLIANYRLENLVHLNTPNIEDYIYLSTSKFETLGLSILESVTKSKKIIAYPGKDSVVKDTYKDFKMFHWITKNLEIDSEIILTALSEEVTQDKYEVNKLLVEEKLVKKKYWDELLEQLYPFKDIKNIENAPINEKRIMREAKNVSKNKMKDNIVMKLKAIDRRWNTSIIDHMLKIKHNYVLKTESNSNNVFIESFHGKSFGGDPKYMALELKVNNSKLNVFVSSANTLTDYEIRSFGLIPIRFNSQRYLSIFKKCKYIIINGNLLSHLPLKSDQLVIQTWHGFPLKKMVGDLNETSERERELELFVPKMKQWDVLLTASKANTKLLNSAFHLSENEKLKIIEEGSPRNSYLIKNRDNIIEQDRIYMKLLLESNKGKKKIVLYCPTWRKNKRKRLSELDLRGIIYKLPEDYIMIVKLHPNENHLSRFYNNIDKRIYSFRNEFVDIQELFLISDVLITDYSSAMFDYAHLNKKIIVLQEDVDDYDENIGFYFNLEKHIGLKANNFTEEELLTEILMDENNHKEYNAAIVEKLLISDSTKSNEKILGLVSKNYSKKDI